MGSFLEGSGAGTYSDPMPVIGDHHALQPSILDGDLDARASRVQRVFQEFLDRVGWSVDNLSGAKEEEKMMISTFVDPERKGEGEVGLRRRRSC